MLQTVVITKWRDTLKEWKDTEQYPHNNTKANNGFPNTKKHQIKEIKVFKMYLDDLVVISYDLFIRQTTDVTFTWKKKLIPFS